MKAKLTWTDPTTRVDGATLLPSEIDFIAFGVTSGNLVPADFRVAAGVQEFTTVDLAPDTLYKWRFETHLKDGKESAGAFVEFTTPAEAPPPPPSTAAPSPVSNLTATIIP